MSARNPGRTIPKVDGCLQAFSADPVTCMQRLQQAHGDLVALRQGDQSVVFAFGGGLQPAGLESSG